MLRPDEKACRDGAWSKACEILSLLRPVVPATHTFGVVKKSKVEDVEETPLYKLWYVKKSKVDDEEESPLFKLWNSKVEDVEESYLKCRNCASGYYVQGLRCCLCGHHWRCLCGHHWRDGEYVLIESDPIESDPDPGPESYDSNDADDDDYTHWLPIYENTDWPPIGS